MLKNVHFQMLWQQMGMAVLNRAISPMEPVDAEQRERDFSPSAIKKITKHMTINRSLAEPFENPLLRWKTKWLSTRRRYLNFNTPARVIVQENLGKQVIRWMDLEDDTQKAQNPA